MQKDTGPVGAGGDIADDGNEGHAETGSAWIDGSKAGAFRGDYRAAPAGAGANTSTWTFDNLTDGTYEAFATWVPHPNRATNAPFSLDGGGGQGLTTTVNQRSAPDDNTLLGFAWESLGLIQVVGGVMTVELTDDANGYVIADAVRVEKLAEILIDDDDAGYGETGGDWFDGNLSSAYRGSYRVNAAGSGGSTATWTAAGLAAGDYEVFATWVAHSNRASNAPYAIADGAVVEGNATVNQKVAADDETAFGVGWESLGVFSIDNGSVTVTLTDDANGYVIADAIRIRPLAAAMAMGGGSSESSITGGSALASQNAAADLLAALDAGSTFADDHDQIFADEDELDGLLAA